MGDSFTLKAIKVEIVQGEGSFEGGGNQKTYGDDQKMAIDVTVQKPGLPEKNSATVKIWGMKYADMASLTTLAFKPLESQHNTIAIYAGVRGASLSLVFSGEITSAYADFNASPDVCMTFEADTGSYPQQMATRTVTVQGDTTAENLFSQWAKEAGYAYKNEGVAASVRNAWFPGSPIAKMRKLARDIDCELIIDDCKVVTMPAGQVREGEGVLLSQETGLIGYPTFTQDGISCKCIYNPALEFGSIVKIESLVPKASGEWQITKLSHHLQANMPSGGDWMSQIEGAYHE